VGRSSHRKAHLPEKLCLQCQRPFAWRKKWERNWDEVKYCSKACSSKAKSDRAGQAGPPAPDAGATRDAAGEM